MTATATGSLEERCINAIRVLSMDAIQKAKSGHPGAPMGAAAMTYTLWTRYLRHNPRNPTWAGRDRFVLSAGHASMLLYSMLHLTGYDLPLDQLRAFRQWQSKTPGHPEHGHTPGVELTTGPLGAGFGMAVGMAVAERFLAEHFNRPGHTIVDHYVYGICSDGDLMEGVASEAASLAGTLGLGKLIFLYDDNEISIEGDTDLAFTERVDERFRAYGWHVLWVDGNDTRAVAQAIESARAESQRPSLIVAKTTLAYGSPNKAGSHEAHGAPLGEDEVKLTKQALGWPEEPPFYLPDDVVAEFRRAVERGAADESEWDQRFAAYAREYPEEAASWRKMMAGELPEGWEAAIPTFTSADGAMATRVASGRVMNALAGVLENFIGGSADLAPSTLTYLKGCGDFGLGERGGHNIHYGVREHAMGQIVNGMALHGGVIPFGATFLIFSDYMRPAIRLAALQQTHSIFIFTHDSIGLGEDGPTHQPIEHLMSLRAMPGLCVLRPADANETAAAWKVAIERRGPTLLVLCRQNLPAIEDTGRVRAGVPRGAYVLAEAEGGQPGVILIATGSEVPIALAARETLQQSGVRTRVVSMPSWDLFAAQPREYRDSVLPPAVRARVAVEAGATLGWERYTGDAGAVAGLDRFGASAPGGVLYEQFGFTPEAIAARAREVLAALEGGR